MLTGARLYSLRRNWLDNEVVISNKQKWCYGYYEFYYIKLKNLSIPNQQQQKKKIKHSFIRLLKFINYIHYHANT